MATIVNIYEAKTQFSRLIEQAERGEEVVVARAGHPVVRLVPYRRRHTPRPLGSLKGKVEILPGFHEHDEEIIAMFEDSTIEPET